MGDLIKLIFGLFLGPLLLLGAFLVMRYTFTIIGINVEPVVSIGIALTPLWLPFLLFYLLYERWVEYVRLKFALDNGRTTLRVKLPQEVFKSPEAMESVMAQIHNMNTPDNLWQTYVDGKHPLIFSFELVSIGGDVRFYVNVPTKKTKNAIEAQLYAQYPGIEVVEEAIDYTAEVVWDPEEWEVMAFHIGKKEDQVFPIKTYLDFGMDKLPKEELKFEPMAAMLEQLGTAKPQDRVWIQILCRPHGKQNFNNGYLHEKGTWDKSIVAKIDEMIGRNSKTKMGPGEFAEQPRLTTTERDTITAMERSASKYAYETGIRVLYAAKAGKFDGNALLIMKTFAQYDIIKRNGLGVRWRTDFDNNWFSDRSGQKRLGLKRAELEAYKQRSYNAYGESDSPKIMSVEELATIWHIPGSSVATPGLGRIPSTRREAPPNLPIATPQ